MGTQQIEEPPEWKAATVHSQQGKVATFFAICSLGFSAFNWVLSVSDNAHSALNLLALVAAAVATKIGLKTLREEGKHAFYQVLGLAGALLAVAAAVYGLAF